MANPTRRLGAIGAVVLGVAWAYPVQAQQTEIVPRIDVGALHETNPRLSRVQEDEATGLLIDALLNMSWSTARTTAFFNPRLRLSRYDDNNDRDLENDDFWLDGGIEHTTARSITGLQAGYSELGVRTSELESASGPVGGGSTDLSFVDDTQQRWYIMPDWEYDITQKDRIRVALNYSDITYDQTDTFRLDYTFLNGDLSWQRSLSEKLALGLLLNVSQYDSDNAAVKADPINNPGRTTDNDNSTYGASLFTNYALSETLDASLYVGYRDTEIKLKQVPFRDIFGTELCVDFNGNVTPPPCEFKVDDSFWVGSASLNRNSERTDLGVTVSRNITPTSNGLQTVRNEIRGTAVHDFSARVRGRLGLLYYNEELAGGDSQDFDRDYISFNASLDWRFTRVLGVRGAYRYVEVDETLPGSSDRKADNHYVFLGVFFRGEGWRW
ncbi:MAG: hypothetical protein QNJ73_05365 [Gammaproteobacteria bacterium]|nr:hypothetical protein [Gammaproteobacteria bacterium]